MAVKRAHVDARASVENLGMKELYKKFDDISISKPVDLEDVDLMTMTLMVMN